jgi:hypothetical protein
MNISPLMQLRAMICFQPCKHHYIAFILAPERSLDIEGGTDVSEAWFCFDDAKVSRVRSRLIDEQHPNSCVLLEATHIS